MAQDSTTVTTTTTQPPVVDITPPPAPTAPAPEIQAPAPAPAIAAPPPAASAPTPEPVDAGAAPVRATAARATAASRRAAPVRTAARAVPVSTAPAPAAATTPAPAAEAPPPPAPATAPLAATPPGTENTTPAPTTAAPATAQPAQPARGSIWPWLIGALVLIGAAALLLRRRRRDEDVYYEEAVDEPEVVAAPIIAPPIAESVAPVATMAPALAETETGRPEIALAMRPVRAGVNEADAVVEFELTVDNRGSAAAHDVRISTWMFPAGQASEAERHLIQPAEEAALPAVTIDSGHAKKIESAVALPTAGLEEDAVLPVVVAEAHYRLPDGTEAQTRASFEVGVPIGEDLAHFDLDNPSGMHEDVVARPHRESVDA
jgi:MYXO-CTERM domain-containing protein